MLPSFVTALDRSIAIAQRRNFPGYLRELREVEGWSAERLRQLQTRKLIALLEHARQSNPYWKDVLGAMAIRSEILAGTDHFTRIPFLTKEIIREQGTRLLSEQRTPGRVRRSSTGGSTGQNIWFAKDAESGDRRRAVERLTDGWEGVRSGTRIATLWGSPIDSKRSILARLYDALGNRIYLSAYGIDSDTGEKYWRQLRSFRPEVIAAYPSILLHLARGIGKDRCRELGLKRVLTSAEPLYPAVRNELEELFGCPARDRYGCREFGRVAAQCPDTGVLHIMDTRFLVESISFEGGPAELVITDLDNRIHPFIRYRILDSAELLPGPCSCGRPFTRLGPVQGRTLDVIVTPGGRAFGGTFFTLMFRPADRAVERFQVVQEAPDRLRVRIVPGPAWSPARAESLQSRLSENLDGMTCRFEVVDDIPPLASGKHRFVVGLAGGNTR